MNDTRIPSRSESRNSQSGLIYYIGSVETRRVKIGYTQGCPFKRLSALQTGSPCELTLMVAHQGTFADEKKIHAKFGQFAVRGEWFELSAEVVVHIFTAIIRLVREHAERGEAPPSWLGRRYALLTESLTGGSAQ